MLRCHQSRVTNLSPLTESPLRDIHCDFNSGRDTMLLKAIKTLELINGKAAAEFWKGSP
jgi:hypothetical protein